MIFILQRERSRHHREPASQRKERERSEERREDPSLCSSLSGEEEPRHGTQREAEDHAS